MCLISANKRDSAAAQYGAVYNRLSEYTIRLWGRVGNIVLYSPRCGESRCGPECGGVTRVCSEIGVLVCHTCLWTLRDFYSTGARARCPRRAVSARLRVVCERTVLNLTHGGLLSCCEWRHSLMSPVPPPGNMRTARAFSLAHFHHPCVRWLTTGSRQINLVARPALQNAE